MGLYIESLHRKMYQMKLFTNHINFKICLLLSDDVLPRVTKIQIAVRRTSLHLTRQRTFLLPPAFARVPACPAHSCRTAAHENGWPDSQWWKAEYDAQLDALIDNAIQHSAGYAGGFKQRIQLAEAQAKAVEAQDGPQLDFSADIERQRMSAKGHGAIRDYRPCGGNDRRGINGTFGLTAGWDLIYGENCCRSDRGGQREAEAYG